MAISKQDIIKYWHSSAKKNLNVSRDLYSIKHRSWSLFMGQLALEKLLKGLIIKLTNQTPPPIHDLKKLAKVAKIPLTHQKITQLDEISSFNIEARYDSYKLDFYRKADKSYTTKWLKIINQLFKWLEKLY